MIEQTVDDARDRLVWRWKGGVVDPADVGDPIAGAELDVCVYDANGYVAGGGLPAGGSLWKSRGTSLLYKDAAALAPGVLKAKVKSSTEPKGLVLARGKGRYLRAPELPLVPPLTAQLANDATGACWESVLDGTDVVRNDAGKLLAKN